MLLATITLAILVAIGLIVAFIALKRSKSGVKKVTNYQVFFNMGIILLPTGIVFLIISLIADYSFAIAIPFLGIGASYLAIGLANKDKWEKQS